MFTTTELVISRAAETHKPFHLVSSWGECVCVCVCVGGGGGEEEERMIFAIFKGDINEMKILIFL